MTAESNFWFLKHPSLFEMLAREEIARLERHALFRSFKRRAFIYAPHELGQSVFVLACGRVKIKDVTLDGRETILSFIDEGELFGELALVDEGPRQEYAEAVLDSDVVLLPRDELLRLLETRPDLALHVTKLIGIRRRRIENRLRNVLFLPSRERVIRLLQELIETHGTRRGRACEIGLPLSHQDLASLIGVTRETVTVVLGKLRDEGLIAPQRRRILVMDVERLTQESAAVASLEDDSR